MVGRRKIRKGREWERAEGGGERGGREKGMDRGKEEGKEGKRGNGYFQFLRRCCAVPLSYTYDIKQPICSNHLSGGHH